MIEIVGWRSFKSPSDNLKSILVCKEFDRLRVVLHYRELDRRFAVIGPCLTTQRMSEQSYHYGIGIQLSSIEKNIDKNPQFLSWISHELFDTLVKDQNDLKYILFFSSDGLLSRHGIDIDFSFQKTQIVMYTNIRR